MDKGSSCHEEHARRFSHLLVHQHPSRRRRFRRDLAWAGGGGSRPVQDQLGPTATLLRPCPRPRPRPRP